MEEHDLIPFLLGEGDILIVAPEGGDKGEQEGEDFETAGEHQERIDPKGGVGDDAPGIERTYEMADGGADVGEGRNAQPDGIEDGEVHHGHGRCAEGDEHDVEEGVGKDGLRDVVAQIVVVEAHGEDGPGVEDALKLVAHNLERGEHAHHFHAAAGAALARTDDADGGEDDPSQVGPEHEVVGGEARGAHQRHGVEEGVAEGLFADGVGLNPLGDGDDDHGQGDDGEEKTQFFVLEHLPEAALDDEEVEQGEVGRGQEHEEGCGIFDGGGVEVGHGLRVGGEAPGGDGGKAVIDGIEEGHAAEVVGEDAAAGDEKIDRPEPMGGGRDARMEFAHLQSGGFGREEFLLADAHGGEDGEGEKDDAHTANPVGEAAPEEDGVGERIDVGEGGSAGGGEARHRFEKGHCHTVGVSVDEEGNHADERINDPNT